MSRSLKIMKKNLECLLYKKNKDKVKRHIDQFYKHSNNPSIQNLGSIVSVEKENYIFQLGKLFSIFYLSKTNFKKSKIEVKKY